MNDPQIDITAEVCPMTFVRTRLALDRLRPGDRLQILLAGAEAWRNVVRNAVALGHSVLSDQPAPAPPAGDQKAGDQKVGGQALDGTRRLLVIRKGPG